MNEQLADESMAQTLKDILHSIDQAVLLRMDSAHIELTDPSHASLRNNY